jgi:hypothetical protein
MSSQLVDVKQLFIGDSLTNKQTIILNKKHVHINQLCIYREKQKKKKEKKRNTPLPHRVL